MKRCSVKVVFGVLTPQSYRTLVFRFGGLGFLFIQIHFFFQSVVVLGNEDRGGKEKGGRGRFRILRDDLSVQRGFRVWSPSVGKWKGGGLIRVFLQPKKRTEGGGTRGQKGKEEEGK
jgi:hypothetical protein